MSRSGYDDDYIETWPMIRWRGAVTSAIRGKRGQALLREMLAALDALPEPKLIAYELIDSDGNCCALGAVAKARAIDVTGIDPEDRYHVSERFGIAYALACEIAYWNDEGSIGPDTPERRFARMRAWVEEQIRDEAMEGKS